MRDAEELLRAAWPDLVRAARLYGASAAAAEDAAQDTVERCLRKWHLVGRADDPQAYAVAVLFNVLKQQGRRRSASEIPLASPSEHEDRASTTGAETPRLELQLDVQAAILSLPEDQRVVVVMRYYLDLSLNAIAAALGRPLGTVKSRHARALAALGVEITPEAHP